MRKRLWLAAVLLAATPVLAQVDDDAADAPAALMPAAEAQALLAQPLPADPAARLALLQQQVRAAQSLEQRGRWVELLAELAQAGRSQPGAEGWVRQYLGAEFVWGSSGKALAAADAFANDTSLPLPTRAAAARPVPPAGLSPPAARQPGLVGRLGCAQFCRAGRGS